MDSLLGAGEVARRLSQHTGTSVAPKTVSDAVYRRFIPEEFVVTVAGRRLIHEAHLDAVREILVERGLVAATAELG